MSKLKRIKILNELGIYEAKDGSLAIEISETEFYFIKTKNGNDFKGVWDKDILTKYSISTSTLKKKNK